MLASHNSWSYLPVRQWYLKPFWFIGKCQEVDLLEQFRLGVRYFDLRLCYNKRLKKIVLCHGLIEYNHDFFADLHRIIAENCLLPRKDPIYCRVLLEDRGRGHTEEGDSAFFRICSELEGTFPDIHFQAGYPLGERWKQNIYHFNNRDIPYAEFYGSITKNWKLIPIPRIYAACNNPKLYENVTYDKDWAYMIDFVNIK